MKFGINNPSFLQSAGNVGGEIDERFYIKALEDNTEVEFLYPEQTLMSTDGVEYVRATNTTLNAGDKLYMYTDGTIILPEYDPFRKMISVSKTFAAAGLIPITTIIMEGEETLERCMLHSSKVFDASKVIVLADGSCESMFDRCESLVKIPKLPATTLTDYCYSYLFASCTSLVNAPELPATTLATGCYEGIFYGCTSLVNAPELPATTLADECYLEIFEGCTSLVNAPELPATTLAASCYSEMFYGCTSLVNAPELPATELEEYCYHSMFEGCTSLVNAPELPATELVDGCYYSMFYGCTSLVNAPELPATTLADECYSRMFSHCTSLVNAPELPATELVDDCYHSMFYGCTSLTEITCLATNISASSCVENWLDLVSETGTFTKSADMNDWPTGDDGIPTGWTVQDYAGDDFEVGEL